MFVCIPCIIFVFLLLRMRRFACGTSSKVKQSELLKAILELFMVYLLIRTVNCWQVVLQICPLKFGIYRRSLVRKLLMVTSTKSAAFASCLIIMISLFRYRVTKQLDFGIQFQVFPWQKLILESIKNGSSASQSIGMENTLQRRAKMRQSWYGKQISSSQ